MLRYRVVLSVLLSATLAACKQDDLPAVDVHLDPPIVDLTVDTPLAPAPTGHVDIVNVGGAEVSIDEVALSGGYADRVELDTAALPAVLGPDEVLSVDLTLVTLPTGDEGLYYEELPLNVLASGVDGVSTGRDIEVGSVQVGSMKACDVDLDGFLSVACGGDDCDDASADTSPAALERCDGFDDDCDGDVDEPDSVDAQVWFADGDGDGFGNPDAPVPGCHRPEGTVGNGFDCDDLRDGTHPGADELCDGRDDNCNGVVDEPSSVDAPIWYADLDGDGFGNATVSRHACEAPPGYVGDGTDCDDGVAAAHPGGVEVCDGHDDDCDGAVDDDPTDPVTFYRDLDGDGHGSTASTALSCAPPAGYVPSSDDCDDGTASVHPGALETCDGVDEDCDGTIDDGAVGGSLWLRDADGDGFGDDAVSMVACTAPAGWATVGKDCDDADGSVYPGASEVCDGVDQNCNGLTDEKAVDAVDWYVDFDGDGFGDPATALLSCDAPTTGATWVADGTDCDDTDPDVHPTAVETCDATDQDCNGSIDDGGVCPCDVVENAGHAYLLCATADTWANARATCVTNGYDLVDVGDATEDAWLDGEIDAYAVGSWWSGFNDRAAEGTFAWADGGAVSYTNWSPGQPDNAGNADCMAFDVTTDGTWADEKCTSTYAYVCESL